MLRRLFGGRGERPAPQAVADPVPSLDPARCLFIIGAARTGTTVLQNALNHAPDIFLLGEPKLHLEGERPDFAHRYNKMHKTWSNQPTKSTYLPLLIDEDGGWRDHLARLTDHFRWVGAKMVPVSPTLEPAFLDDIFAFYARHFYAAHYIITFRAPLDVVKSTRDLQSFNGAVQQGHRVLLAHYADMIALFIRMVRNLPHVRAVFHEDVDAGVLDDLGRWLGVPLDGAAAYYDKARVRSYAPEGLDAREQELLGQLNGVYADLKRGAAQGFERPQIEQNDTNITPGHYTLLGSLARRCEMIAAAFRQEPGET